LDLESNDILFIDSSHVVRCGGDVTFLVLEVLPRLRPGVLVHFHDVFFPREYPRELLLQLGRFWTEQYLVQAFLMWHSAFELVRERFPEVRLVALPANVGPAAAANAGAAVARGDYLALLNDDAWPEPGWLEELVECARRHPRAGSVASKILRRSDRSLLDG